MSRRATSENFIPGPSRSEHEAGLLGPQHLVRTHRLDVKCDASVWNLDLLDRVRCNFVGHDIKSVSKGMGHQVVVSYLQKRTHC